MNRNNQNPERGSIEPDFNSEQENLHLDNPEHPQIETGDIEAIIEREKELEGQIETSDLPEEVKKGFLKRLKKLSKKVGLVLGGIVLMGVVSDYVKYQNSRYSVNESRKDNGEIVFKHEDPETTRAINILAGTETLNESEAIQILRAMLKSEVIRKSKDESDDSLNDLKTNSNEYLQFLETATTEELVDFAVKKLEWYASEIDSEKATASEQIIAWVIGTGTESPTIKKELYEALWKMEQECGNPKVRIVGEKPSGVFNIDKSCYVSDTNTIYIIPRKTDAAYEYFISELAHSKQEEESPISTRLQRTLDLITVYNRVWETSESVEDAYNKELYSKPGTVEHDAHSVIEPELDKKLETLRPNNTVYLEIWQFETDRDSIGSLLEDNPKERKQINNLFSQYEKDFRTLSKQFLRNSKEQQGTEKKLELIEIYKTQTMNLRDKFFKDLNKIVVVDESMIPVG